MVENVCFPCVIYGVYDPRDKSCLYVGSTVNGMSRPMAHLRHAIRDPRTDFEWALNELRLAAKYRELERCAHSMRRQREQYWIDRERPKHNMRREIKLRIAWGGHSVPDCRGQMVMDFMRDNEKRDRRYRKAHDLRHLSSYNKLGTSGYEFVGVASWIDPKERFIGMNVPSQLAASWKRQREADDRILALWRKMRKYDQATIEHLWRHKGRDRPQQYCGDMMKWREFNDYLDITTWNEAANQ